MRPFMFMLSLFSTFLRIQTSFLQSDCRKGSHGLHRPVLQKSSARRRQLCPRGSLSPSRPHPLSPSVLPLIIFFWKHPPSHHVFGPQVLTKELSILHASLLGQRKVLICFGGPFGLHFLTLKNNYNNNNIAFQSQTSWGRLELKPTKSP